MGKKPTVSLQVYKGNKLRYNKDVKVQNENHPDKIQYDTIKSANFIMKYDETNIPDRYNAARAMSQEAMALWLEAVARYVSVAEIRTIVDVGCGTGPF